MPPRTRTQDFSDASDRKVFGDIAEEKARERAANDARRAALARQIAGASAELIELQVRLIRLVAAQAGCDEISNLINVKQMFAASFIGKMYEAPGTVRVDVSSRDWAGKAASSFAVTHGSVSSKLAGAASTSVATLTDYRSRLDESQTKLSTAFELLMARISEVQKLIEQKNAEISNLSAQLRAIPN